MPGPFISSIDSKGRPTDNLSEGRASVGSMSGVCYIPLQAALTVMAALETFKFPLIQSVTSAQCGILCPGDPPSPVLVPNSVNPLQGNLVPTLQAQPGRFIDICRHPWLYM